MRQVPARLWVCAIFSALLMLLPFPLAGPVPEWRRAFCWVCLLPLLYALVQRDGSEQGISAWGYAALGYVCGVIWFLGNCYWIFPTMHLYGALASPVAAGILVLFALYLGLYFALFAWIVRWIAGGISQAAALAMAPFAWVGVELARARVTGFPWDLLGYTQVDNMAVARLATITGVMGLSLLVAGVNALWAGGFVAVKRAWRVACFAVAALVCATSVIVQATWKPAPEAATENAVLVQDNISVGAAAGPAETRDALIASLSGWSRAPETLDADAPGWRTVEGFRPTVVLWPEAPADLMDGDAVFRADLGALARSMDAPVIADSVAVEAAARRGEPPREYNSASFFSADGQYRGRYDKMHLVPFGEYTPYKQLFFFAGHLLDNVGGFTPGTARTLFTTGGESYGVFICYESIFGDEVRQLTLAGANVLVNLSDDGWYGDSSAPWEHLDMARMRAIENHRWLLRSTNTGVTTVIDPDGRVGAELPRHVRGALDAAFGFESGTTFYVRYGDWLGWLCAFVTGAALLLALARTRRASGKAIH